MRLYLRFYKALLICAIGSKRYYLKLLALASSAVVVSITGFIFVGRYKLVLYNLPHLNWIIYSTVSLSVAFCLLLGIQINTRLNQSTRLLASLPLSRAQRWTLSLAGDLLIALFYAASIIGPIIIVSSLAHHWLQVIVIAVLGLLTGIAANYMYKSRSFVARLVGVIAIGVCIKTTANHILVMGELSVILVIYLIFTIVFARALFTQQSVASRLPITETNRFMIKISPLPWPLKLAVRFKPLIMSMTVCLGLVLSIIFFAKKNNLVLDNSILSICTLFIGSSVADIRSVFRVSKPPEIACLKGTLYWFINYTLSCISIGAFLALPVIIVFPLSSIDLAIEITLAISIGILSSVTIGNSQKDMSSQFMTNLLILALTYCTKRLDLTATIHSAALIVIAIGMSLLIEQFRNNFIWRRVDETVTN